MNPGFLLLSLMRAQLELDYTYLNFDIRLSLIWLHSNWFKKCLRRFVGSFFFYGRNWNFSDKIDPNIPVFSFFLYINFR